MFNIGVIDVNKLLYNQELMSLENFKLLNWRNELASELYNLRRIEEGNPPSLKPSQNQC